MEESSRPQYKTIQIGCLQEFLRVSHHFWRHCPTRWPTGTGIVARRGAGMGNKRT